MKIGIYDPYLDDCGGGEKYMMTIAQCLSKSHKVSVFWDNVVDFKNVSERFNLDLSKTSLVPNIFSPKTSFLNRLNQSKKYDVIIFLSDGSIPFVSSKLFLHMQRPLLHVKLTLFDKLKVRRVHTFFCNSMYTKAYIDKTYNIKSLILYPPVSVNYKKNKKENMILHVGRFRVVDKAIGVSDFKKQHVMIQAFKEMIDHGLKKWKLVMAVSVKQEDKSEFEYMKKTAGGYPIEFAVNKSNTELWAYYSKAKIYWHASGFGEDLEKKPEAAEHFGISTVEAMGAGVVPVVVNAGGQKEIVTDGENGLLWSTLAELIEVTLILISSQETLRELSENAQKRASDFSLENFEKKLTSIMVK